MKEQYYRKTVLSALFTELAKKHPKDKALLIQIWECIKELGEKDCGDCKKCKMRSRCDALDGAKHLFMRHHDIQDSDEYWIETVHDADRFAKDSRFAYSLATTVLTELSETSKEKMNESKVG